MLSKFKNVYVLAPHTDDGELGAGGTISKLIEQAANIFYFQFLKFVLVKNKLIAH